MDCPKLLKLIKPLKMCQNLTKLSLAHCKIGDEGGAVVSKFLEDHIHVIHLDLNNNNIGK